MTAARTTDWRTGGRGLEAVGPEDAAEGEEKDHGGHGLDPAARRDRAGADHHQARDQHPAGLAESWPGMARTRRSAR